jgi:hypothetical protein
MANRLGIFLGVIILALGIFVVWVISDDPYGPATNDVMKVAALGAVVVHLFTRALGWVITGKKQAEARRLRPPSFLK